jgi:hypothetical protein
MGNPTSPNGAATVRSARTVAAHAKAFRGEASRPQDGRGHAGFPDGVLERPEVGMRYRPGAGRGALRGQQHDATDAARFRDLDDRMCVDLLAAAGDEGEERLGAVEYRAQLSGSARSACRCAVPFGRSAAQFDRDSRA